MSDPLPPDPYKALGLAKDTSADAVRKAFRKLALRCHPDKTKALPETERKQKEEEFHSIKNAHDLLVDDEERRRYDLKAEREALLQRRTTYGPSKTSQNGPQPHRPQPSKSTTTPIFQARPVYEFREPKSMGHEDFPRSRYESTPRRSAPKSYDDYYEDSSPASSRRNSGRVAEERHDRREDDERIREKHKEQQIKERAKKLRAEVDRERDRKLRADRQESHTKHYYHVRADSESEEEDVTRFMNSTKKRSPIRKTIHPEERRHESRRSASRREEEKARRSRSEESSESSSSSSSEDERHNGKSSSLEDKYHIAQQYIKSSGSRVPGEREKRPSAVKTKTSSKKAPPPAPSVPVDNPRRSSARRGSSQLKPSSKVKPEIVDPPSAYPTYEDRDRRDTRDLKKSSSPRFQHQPRAATFNEKTEKLPSSLRRAQTTPVTQVSPANHTPIKQSHLRNTQIQDYDSSSDSQGASPDPVPYASKTSVKYRYVPASAEEEARNGSSRTYNLVDIEPLHTSPKQYAERERDREPTSSYRRGGISRSQTFQPENIARDPGRRSQPHSASNSANGRKLFGEIGIEHSNISFSPRYGPEDINYGQYARRGSEDRENFANEYISRTSRPLHPGMGSRQGSYTAGVKG